MIRRSSYEWKLHELVLAVFKEGVRIMTAKRGVAVTSLLYCACEIMPYLFRHSTNKGTFIVPTGYHGTNIHLANRPDTNQATY